MDPGVFLVRGRDRGDAVDALASSVVSSGGARAGVRGVLGDLNRTATAARVPAAAARWGFRWDDQDQRSTRWWPQGVTTSGDAEAGGLYDGRPVVCTSWYSKTVGGSNRGARLTFVDVSQPERLRYRHVLLIEATVRQDGTLSVTPLEVHAGGIVWHRDHLWVAATGRGIYVCHLGDLLHVPSGGDPSVLGTSEGHSTGSGWFGYRYVLPVRFRYEGRAEEGAERLRYSFLSLARTDRGPQLVAGEYARAGAGASTRLVELVLDPETSLLSTRRADARAVPSAWHVTGVQAMQGAVLVDGSWFLATSAGRFRRGTLHVGRPPLLRRRTWALPVGVEDLTYWPERDELWSLSEYPGRRYVFAMDRAALL